MDVATKQLLSVPALTRSPLGRTSLEVSPLCVGGSPLGSVPHIFGHETTAEDGVATALAALTGPVNFLDTSNSYSDGESERRVGMALRQLGGLPPGRVLATKLDRDLSTGDFSGARMWRSLEESLERLGVSSLQLLYLHDPEHVGFEKAMRPGEAVEALTRMRDEGIVDCIGVAGGPASMLTDFVRTDVFDVVLTHNRFTLVDRSSDALIDEATQRGMGVVNAAVFGGGVLATGPRNPLKYAYREATEGVATAIHKVSAIAEAHRVPLAALAMQFSTRDPRIHSTVVGVSTSQRLLRTVEQYRYPIPDELWDEVRDVAAPRSEWLG